MHSNIRWMIAIWNPGHAPSVSGGGEFRRKLYLLCWILLTSGAVTTAMVARASSSAPVPKIGRAVISALLRQGVEQPSIIAHVDLTKPFETASQWTLVVARQRVVPTEIAMLESIGPISVCLVKVTQPDCHLGFYRNVRSNLRWFGTPFYLFASRVVYAGPDDHKPLLMLKVCGARSGDGNCGIATALYEYNRAADRFARVFLNVTGSNNNQGTRFIERGPLRGDVIVNYPTEKAPYTYWIEVYRAGKSGQYARILRYRGRTHYGDRNPLAVIDSEMPEILGHLGYWRRGDALPIPPRMPPGCTRLSFRRGEEWCR